MAIEESVESLKRELDLLRAQLNEERKHKPSKSVLGEIEEVRIYDEKRFTKSSLSNDIDYAIQSGLLLPIDSRRGKWILHDRQVLSKSETIEEIALKIRETWSWCGRTIIVDKIVPIPLNDLQQEEKKHPVKKDKQSEKKENNPVHEVILQEESHEVRSPEKPQQMTTPSSTENYLLNKEQEPVHKEEEVEVKQVLTEAISKPISNHLSKKAELEA
jgi:hypothetical protein